MGLFSLPQHHMQYFFLAGTEKEAQLFIPTLFGM